ncbi:MAG: site-2 protease family protein [Gaiella sp.]
MSFPERPPNPLDVHREQGPARDPVSGEVWQPIGHAPATSKGTLARIFGPLVVIGAFLLKFAGALKFLGIFISVGGYALIGGWKWAIGLVGLIAIHEAGHYIEAKRQGLNPSLPVFVPFLGAYVALKNQRFDPWRNALVSLAGPVVGGLGALGVFIAGEATDSYTLISLGYTGFLLNLFNLIPIGFFDGGHILRAWQVLRRGGGAPTAARARSLGVAVAVLAVATAVALALGMWAAHVPQNRL